MPEPLQTRAELLRARLRLEIGQCAAKSSHDDESYIAPSVIPIKFE